jgi:hypothetical protein
VEPQLGWAWLSQRERRTAELALADLGPDGTRDELGFGVIHFAYADRFFPGTSVQHTQLRYVWFVCWNYLELQRRFAGEPFPRLELERIEDRTGHKLLRRYGREDGHGIIGGRVLRVERSPVVKPSAVYWNAMRSWGIVRPLSTMQGPAARSELHWRWEELTDRRARPEVDAEPSKPLFDDVPPVPSRWRSQSEPLGFELDIAQDEAGRIRRAWARGRDDLGRTSLLSRLAERGGVPRSMTSRDVLSVCHADERACLGRARAAGALAAIARAVHTALVQRMKDPDGEQASETRRWVDEAVASFAAQASSLDIAKLLTDVPDAAKLVGLVQATQHWLAAGAGDMAPLESIYRERETAQKPGRALLARSGDERRRGWWPRRSGPLTYRWDQVSGFLSQLDGR